MKRDYNKLILKKNIAVFDFDGTLIKGDSIKLYCKWLSNNCIDFYFNYHFRFRLLKIFYSKVDLKYERVKYFFKRKKKYDKDIEEFNSILKNHLYLDSLDLLKKENFFLDVYIVSASFSEIIEPFCVNMLNVNLITNNLDTYSSASDINFKNKIEALKSNIERDYTIIRGYGNSAGDYDFMEISTQAFLRLPNGQYEIWKK